jgi:hypothetical protein
VPLFVKATLPATERRGLDLSHKNGVTGDRDLFYLLRGGFVDDAGNAEGLVLAGGFLAGRYPV